MTGQKFHNKFKSRGYKQFKADKFEWFSRQYRFKPFFKKKFFVWNIEYDFEFWIIWTINQNYHSLQYYMESAPSPGHYLHICQLIYFKLILSLLDQSSCTVQHQFLIQHLLYCILTLYIIVLVIRYVPDQCTVYGTHYYVVYVPLRTFTVWRQIKNYYYLLQYYHKSDIRPSRQSSSLALKTVSLSRQL